MGGGDGGAGAIKAQNLKNQQDVNRGMTSLNSIFFGGKYGADQASAYKPGGSYYDAGGNVLGQNSSGYQDWLKGYNPETQANGKALSVQDRIQNGKLAQQHAGGTGSSLPALPANPYDTYMAEQAKAGGLYGSTQTSTGFDKAFYDKQQQDYLNYANPQLEQQFGQTNQQLQYKLGNQGLFGGSAQRELQTGLANEKSLAQINMSNQALGQSNQARQNVNSQYNTLVGQLEASMNPGVTTQQALQSASTFSAPSAMPAVGQLFNNYANTYLAGLNQNTYGNMGGSGMNYNNQFSAPVANTVTNRNG
jgi:hypothetical protein